MKALTNAAICLLSALIVLCQFSCKTQSGYRYRIGISQLGEDDEWRKDMKENLYRELVFYPHIEAIYRQADYNSRKQVEQIRELMEQGIDLLIVSPHEADPLTAVVEEAYNKGIKVIVVDRNINSESYNCYIGANNWQVGYIAGIYAANHLNSKGRIVEITGLSTSTPARDREQGFAEALKKFPGITLQRVISGDWLEGSVEEQLPPVVEELKKVDLIFAHNDVMARIAARICNKAGLQDIKIIGVDALPGTGLNLVKDQVLLASVLYPTGGAEAIRIADRLLRNENVPRKILQETIVVDSTNAIMLQQQANKISEQQQSIVRQQQLLEKQTKTFKTQRNLIVVLLSSLALSLMLAGLLVYQRGKNIRFNRKLQAQNEEISMQSRQIVEMAEKAREANEEKLNFFTNISHELKTPLTLILAPTDEALKTPRLAPATREQFLLIKKSANRLLLLVNQLMDFRKLEMNKMRVEPQETDLIRFLHDIVTAFSVFARQHNIDCRIITKESRLPVWIDPEKIEKVFFNILSNAFKFTDDNGFIHVNIEKDTRAKIAVIKIQDSGSGIGKDEQGHLFEMFYQAGYGTKGTGLGLALSRELLDLHQGTISVESEKDKGATFTICLKLGSTHYSEGQLNHSRQSYSSQVSAWIESYYTPQTLQQGGVPDVAVPAAESRDKSTLLIVEDHDDLRQFLSNALAGEYNIITARDGAEGIKKVFDDMPDVVISDIMMPHKDGIALTKAVKDDIRTRHIPVILMTARATETNRLEGLTAYADAYLAKPLNVDILGGTINSLLENRNKLKEHYSAEIPAGIGGELNKKHNRSFLKHLSSIIEQNIPNENFSIEDICREMHISRIQLYRKARLVLDSSINDHILHMRIQRARHYLQNEDLSIAEIAAKTGFSTASYFSTTFKRIVNENPKNYRDRFR